MQFSTKELIILSFEHIEMIIQNFMSRFEWHIYCSILCPLIVEITNFPIFCVKLCYSIKNDKLK
jgi:hypothetical protein